MLEQLQSWLGKDKNHRRPRPRFIPMLEALEERWCLDAYLWDPAGANLLANNPANWRKNGNFQGNNGTLPGTNANDTVTLDGNISNQNIEWNQNFTFSTMTVQGTYAGTQTIDKNTTVDLTGVNGNTSLDASKQTLEIDFADNTAMLQIDNNATISAFGFAQAPGGTTGGTILIDDGTTTICTGVNPIGSTLWGTLIVSNANEGETTTTLEDKGQSSLALIGNNTTIQVSPFAVMQVDGGAGQTLISEPRAGSNDYIWVNGGELDYLGKAGATDTFITSARKIIN